AERPGDAGMASERAGVAEGEPEWDRDDPHPPVHLGVVVGDLENEVRPRAEKPVVDPEAAGDDRVAVDVPPGNKHTGVVDGDAPGGDPAICIDREQLSIRRADGRFIDPEEPGD